MKRSQIDVGDAPFPHVLINECGKKKSGGKMTLQRHYIEKQYVKKDGIRILKDNSNNILVHIQNRENTKEILDIRKNPSLMGRDPSTEERSVKTDDAPPDLLLMLRHKAYDNIFSFSTEEEKEAVIGKIIETAKEGNREAINALVEAVKRDFLNNRNVESIIMAYAKEIKGERKNLHLHNVEEIDDIGIHTRSRPYYQVKY